MAYDYLQASCIIFGVFLKAGQHSTNSKKFFSCIINAFWHFNAIVLNRDNKITVICNLS